VANIAELLLAFCTALLLAFCAALLCAVVVETIKDATKIFSNRVLFSILSFDLVFETNGIGYKVGMGMRFRGLSFEFCSSNNGEGGGQVMRLF
jgi:hypothetical protein